MHDVLLSVVDNTVARVHREPHGFEDSVGEQVFEIVFLINWKFENKAEN